VLCQADTEFDANLFWRLMHEKERFYTHSKMWNGTYKKIKGYYHGNSKSNYTCSD
jgi:hypothetical protein